MFAGRRRRSSNIRVMQLFHELKQQFPTVPDHVVNACIANHAHSPNQDTTIREFLEAAVALNQPPKESMGRTPPPRETPILTLDQSLAHPISQTTERNNRSDMTDSENSDLNSNVPTTVTYCKRFGSVNVQTPSKGAKRPDCLNIRKETLSTFGAKVSPVAEATGSARNIQLSERCKDVHKLLHSDHVSDKPPRSPITNKRFINAKTSPTRSPLASPDLQKRLQTEELKKKATASTPTQTTDTLVSGGSVNLSVNVNCSMNVLPSPTRRTSVLQMTPQQPWLQEPLSPRSYTSVNLTLRTPSTEPQPPIDITSKNSSLTYSTSSFDSQKGLQSRLQITVGPGGGNVSSVRVRPRSSYHPDNPEIDEVVPMRAGSLNNLTDISEPPVILKQQARIERLRIELRTEKTRLQVMQNEVAELEGNQIQVLDQKTDSEVAKQLEKEIRHLQCQCEQLAFQADKNAPEDFYHNLYTGQRGPLNSDFSVRSRRSNPSDRRTFGDRGQSPLAAFQDYEGPKWNCHLCTFLNHPDLDKCEQCEMPRILHGKRLSHPDMHTNMEPLANNQPNPIVPSQSLPNFQDHRTPIVPLRTNTRKYVAQNLNVTYPPINRPN